MHATANEKRRVHAVQAKGSLCRYIQPTPSMAHGLHQVAAGEHVFAEPGSQRATITAMRRSNTTTCPRLHAHERRLHCACPVQLNPVQRKRVKDKEEAQSRSTLVIEAVLTYPGVFFIESLPSWSTNHLSFHFFLLLERSDFLAAAY